MEAGRFHVRKKKHWIHNQGHFPTLRSNFSQLQLTPHKSEQQLKNILSYNKNK